MKLKMRKTHSIFCHIFITSGILNSLHCFKLSSVISFLISEELSLTIFIIQVGCRRLEGKSDLLLPYGQKGKSGVSVPFFRESSSGPHMTFPTVWEFWGPRKCAHPELISLSTQTYIMDSQEPEISYETASLVSSPYLFSGITLTMEDLGVAICCGGVDRAQMCTLRCLPICVRGLLWYRMDPQEGEGRQRIRS